ncbi:MAG: hypothetical protein ACKVS6_01880 [Planctomycetota bacterium]
MIRAARLILLLILLSILLFGCASHSSEEIAEALRRIQAASPATAPVDPVRMTRREQLQFDVDRQTELLNRAALANDLEALLRAEAALEKAKIALSDEDKRIQQLAELRARTPKRIIPQLTTTRAAASRPVEIVHSAPASLPASSPADLQLKEILDRINSLAELRESAGDPGGAGRLRQRAAAWRIEYYKGNQAKALTELQKTLDQADR